MADTSKTRDQLIDRAAAELGLVQPGEPLSSEDKDTIDNLVDPLIAQLSADEIIGIQDVEEIDVAAFLPLGRLLALEAGPSFGNDKIQTLLTNNRAVNVDALKDREYAMLRRLSAQRPPYQPLQVDFF